MKKSNLNIDMPETFPCELYDLTSEKIKHALCEMEEQIQDELQINRLRQIKSIEWAKKFIVF